ncbi:bifunctional oligoribonuclease/PAP phosphatase NrnA [Fibrobacterota bacterium]
MIWSKLQNITENNQSFLLSSHINPDGDSICSQLAFYWYLTSLKKDVVIYNQDPVPDKFHFLYNSDKIVNTFPRREFEVFVIIDASNSERLGWDTSGKFAQQVVVIDHHRDNSYEGELNIVDINASATSEILYTFFKECSVNYPSYVAEALYAGILTDTGGFQFSNTKSYVLRICAELSEKGANCSEIYREIYSSYSPAGLQLRARIWSTLQFYSDNRISSMEIEESLIDKSGANRGEVEGMSDLALTAADVY